MGAKKLKTKILISPEMIRAGASVIEDATLGCSALEGISGQAERIATEVFLAMAEASRNQNLILSCK